MGIVTKAITDFVQDNAIPAAWFIALSIVAIAIMVTDKLKKRNKYVYWKKRTVHFGIFTDEYVRTDDVVLQQLFDENSRLEAENKSLKKRYSQLSLVLFLGLILVLVSMWVSQKFNAVKAWIRPTRPTS
ncbi:hypothetical protein [Spirosoma utsteinense]|uniref:Uncharacterized protein n=1 Tax=Spirosoma utsteinense TaxID=2585773 RepID=A0ABR6WFL5_9BACT|nr:hypothetical protein [Spirosoma utsteinense]MBC3789451.1 hypothetical protein [Spirosoma utsteinense]MBC3794953.1 hypothetical protein [Spirosoma utsteinense]